MPGTCWVLTHYFFPPSKESLRLTLFLLNLLSDLNINKRTLFPNLSPGNLVGRRINWLPTHCQPATWLKPRAWWAGAFQPILPKCFLPNLPCESWMRGLLCSVDCCALVGKFGCELIPSACHLGFLSSGEEACPYGPLSPLKSSHVIWVANLSGIYFNPRSSFLGHIVSSTSLSGVMPHTDFTFNY